MTPREERAAILRGMREALRLQRDLGLNEGDNRSRRIDVFGCIDRCGATLMFQPLDPLLGAFVREGTTAGILLSTRRPLGQQRFTAAHELGHLRLGHDPHADDEGILRRGPIAGGNGFPEITGEEREADAFAPYFLLPTWLIKEQMELHGWAKSDFAVPSIVYQASLRFGTSYSGTVYGLEREKVINRRLRHRLLEVQPRELKRALLPDYPLMTTQGVDVWHLTERDEGAVIEAGRDDLFLLWLREDSGAGYVWTFDELKEAGFAILKDGREPVSEGGRIGAPTIRRVLARSDRPLSGTYRLHECRPWAPKDEPRALTLHCSTATSDQSGLFRPQLEELLAAS
jgi:predicted secreted protein